jgi:isopentenyldiphosphate isomerase
MELWSVYDKERIVTNKTIERCKELAENEFHLVVHICIFNSSDQMLIQQRQPFKEGWSNMWDLSVGGSAVAGETSSMAAERELFEEIGYKADLSNERPFITVNFQRGFDDYYLLEKDLDLSTLKLQYEEVQKVKWATKAEILHMIKTGCFIPYYNSLIDTLFEMRQRRGSHCV